MRECAVKRFFQELNHAIIVSSNSFDHEAGKNTLAINSLFCSFICFSCRSTSREKEINIIKTSSYLGDDYLQMKSALFLCSDNRSYALFEERRLPQQTGNESKKELLLETGYCLWLTMLFTMLFDNCSKPLQF